MDIFTQDEMRPSDKILNLIRQMAYTYRVVEVNGKKESFCLN